MRVMRRMAVRFTDPQPERGMVIPMLEFAGMVGPVLLGDCFIGLVPEDKVPFLNSLRGVESVKEADFFDGFLLRD